MNIWKELGRLQVQAEGTPVADGIANIRRVLLLDQARSRAGVALDQARRESWQGERDGVCRRRILILGRFVQVPGSLIPLLETLADANGVPLDRSALAARVFGRSDGARRQRISDLGGQLQGALLVQDVGLILHRGKGGYLLLDDPLTLAQMREVRDSA